MAAAEHRRDKGPLDVTPFSAIEPPGLDRRDVLINVGTFTLGGGREYEIRFNGADISQAIAPLGANGFNIPSLLSVHETAPYLYNGLAQKLEEVLDSSHDGNGGVRGGAHTVEPRITETAPLLSGSPVGFVRLLHTPL